MKQLKWTVVDRDGKMIEWCRTRDAARDIKTCYCENLFEDWMGPWKPPFKIIREEWELVGKKVVR